MVTLLEQLCHENPWSPWLQSLNILVPWLVSLASNPGFPFYILFCSLPQSCETKSGTKSSGLRLAFYKPLNTVMVRWFQRIDTLLSRYVDTTPKIDTPYIIAISPLFVTHLYLCWHCTPVVCTQLWHHCHPSQYLHTLSPIFHWCRSRSYLHSPEVH